MEKICDLHTHSIFSDGTWTPSELIDGAINAGISALALTDHNTVEGLPHFIDAAAGKDIEAVLGCEFSVDYEEKELHMLGLFIDPKYFPQITDMMNDVMARKEKSNIDLVESLTKAGIILDYDKIKGATPSGKVNRAHIASAMLENGYVGSVKEAFSRYLKPELGFYKEPKRLSVWETIDYIQSIGAVSVLAHPFLQLDEEGLVKFLPKAKEHGLVGMECYYSTNDEKQTADSLRIADAFGLLYSGGSDFHGTRKPDIELGVGKGNLRIPYDWCLALKEKSK